MKASACFGAALVLLTITQCAYGKSPPPGTGQADVPANILIMLDTSGSMSARVNTNISFYYPTDVAVDSKDNIFVVEHSYHRIKKFNSAGKLLKQWGRYGTGNGSFRYPYRIAIDSNDKVYVTDYYNHRIQKFSNEGVYEQKFPAWGGWGTLTFPVGVFVDKSGNVYGGGTNARRVVKFSATGALLNNWTVRGRQHAVFGVTTVLERGGRMYPGDNDGHIYTAGRDGSRVDGFRSDYRYVKGWYSNSPTDIEATANGLYTANLYEHRVRRYSTAGAGEWAWGGYGTGNGQFRYPMGLGSDSAGNIYVADYYNHAIKKYDPTGNFLDINKLAGISTLGGPASSRLGEAKKVIKKLVSSSDLTKGANFGLMEWNSSARLRVKVSSSGAAAIYNTIDSLRAMGGTNLDSALNLAKSYFLGSNSPIIKNTICQKNFLIVISDGYWSDRQASNVAAQLYKNNGIQTFVVGFHSAGGSNYVKLAKAGGTHPDSPLFTDNWQHLYTTLSDYIRQAIASQQTFTAPLIMPGISTDDYLYQSTFNYKKTHQWEGHLKKYQLKAKDGSIGNLMWDAGEKLNKKSSSSRQIWTVANHVGISSGLNNFQTGNLAGLKTLIYEGSGTNPTDAEATSLINFVRGVDAYDEDADGNTTDERWKLGDIYHSELTVVGPPTAKTSTEKEDVNKEAYYRAKKNYAGFRGGNRCGGSCPSRKSVVYAGANDGMLHAFDAKTGDELWAFIPPAMLPNLRNMASVKANATNAIYGVDGSPVVQDVFYKNQWRTLLMAGLGRGGHSYFALDVTNPKNPLFLFSFSNDPTDKIIRHWDAKGNLTELGYVSGNIPAEYDYSKLGEAWSTPTIMAMPVGSDRKWVAAFGAGFNSGTNPNYGSAVYVVDFEDQGKVLKRIDLTDASGDIANSAPATLTAITADTTSTATYKGAILYVADLESKTWKINLTNTGTLYAATQLFDGEGTTTNDRMTFFPITPSIGVDGKLWLYSGTGNQQKLQRMDASIKNRIFGVRDKDFPSFLSVSSSTISKMKNVTKTGAICPADVDIGWYVDLDTNEKVTGKVAVHNEVVFVSRYTPNKSNLCNPGSNKLSEHGYGCGKPQSETSLGTGILTGAQIFKGKIYLGVSGALASSSGKPASGFSQEGNIVVGTPSNKSSSSGAVQIESWREVF